MAYTPGTLHVLRSTPDGRFPEGAWMRLVPSVPRIHDLGGRLVLAGAVEVKLALATVDGRDVGEVSVELPPTHGMDPDPVTWTAHLFMPGSVQPEPPVEGIVITSGQVTELASWTSVPTPSAVPNVQRSAEAARDAAVGAAGDAQAAAGAAAGSRTAAAASAAAAATDAGAARQAALDADADRQAAASSATAAAGSATSAAGSADTATGAATTATTRAGEAASSAGTATARAGDATTAATTATGARDAAQTSATAAEGARAAAVVARTGAETARDTAVTAASDADADRAAAQAAATTATDKAAAIPALPVLARNRHLNPRVATDLNGWGQTVGTGGVTTFTRVAAGGPDDHGYAQLAWTTAPTGGTPQLSTANGASVLAGSVVAGDVVAFAFQGWSTIPSISVVLDWFDGSGVYLSSTSLSRTITPSTWTDLRISGTAPANASRFAVQLRPNSLPAVGDTLRATDAMWDKVAALPTSYFDATTPGARAGAGGIAELVAPRNADLVDRSRQAVRYFEGTGSPEGTVAAAPGAEYVDLAGTNGAWVWRKRTGVGATGWVVVDGDTGWRNISSLIGNGWTGTVYLRRSNSNVSLQFQLNGAAAAGPDFLAGGAPVGFRPSGFASRMIGYTTTSTPTVRRGFSMSALVLPAYPTAETLYGEHASLTGDPWPAVLPGSPA